MIVLKPTLYRSNILNKRKKSVYKETRLHLKPKGGSVERI